MKTFNEMQEMARRNPDQNPRIPAFKQLEKYNSKDYFFSFTSLKRIGIRPSSPHNTPNGIYTFPATILDDLAGNMNNVPYVNDMPYIHVLKKKGRGIIDPLESYSNGDLKKDIKKLWKILNTEKKGLPLNEQGIKNVEIILDIAKREATIKSPFGILWNITRMITIAFSGFFGWGGVDSSETKEWYTDDDKWEEGSYKPKDRRRKRKDRNKRTGRKYLRHGVTANAQGWNNLFRRLGYQGFVDRSGSGIIHPNEPKQAMFLSIKAFDVVDMIENKSYERLELNSGIDDYLDVLKKKSNNMSIVGHMNDTDIRILKDLSEAQIAGCDISFHKHKFYLKHGEINDLTAFNNIKFEEVYITGGSYQRIENMNKCVITGGEFLRCTETKCEVIGGFHDMCEFVDADLIQNTEISNCRVKKVTFFGCELRYCTLNDCSVGRGCNVKYGIMEGETARLILDADIFFHRVKIIRASIIKGKYKECIMEECSIKGGEFEYGKVEYSIIKAGTFKTVRIRLSDKQGGTFED